MLASARGSMQASPPTTITKRNPLDNPDKIGTFMVLDKQDIIRIFEKKKKKQE